MEYGIEWNPAETAGNGLEMSIRLNGRSAVQAFAAWPGAPETFRLRTPDGAEVVTASTEVLSWSGASALPASAGTMTPPRVDQDDAEHALDLLEALLAWSRSRGLIDEAVSRRISRFVQMTMTGEARDTPR